MALPDLLLLPGNDLKTFEARAVLLPSAEA